jgi:hypothetical protein
MMPGPGGDVNTTLPLILSIVSLACCWGSTGLSFILGVIGLVFAIQAGSAKSSGDMEGARAKAKTSLILAIVGLSVGFVGGMIIGILRALD